ncbi:Peptidase T [Frankliniella fusca]|uniref:Peptidase T n=1 Tax=Frankliniella fusca TaxID=407009 RepID=A0AAE1HJ39_9NEOP|nr:Peptidase T [Frankliniella fusca]
MEEGNDIEAALTSEEVEFAQTTARYGEVLSKCKLLRSRLMMISRNLTANSGNQELDAPETAVIDSLDKLEEQFHRISIQEEMLKNIKVTKLALDLFTSEQHTYEGLDDLIKEHCANQAKLYELAQSLREERLTHKKAIGQLLEQLCHYTSSLKDDQVKLESATSPDSTSTLELNKHMEKQIKEIRFMQICISKLVANMDIDLRENETVKEILKSVRSPITSVDNFI